MTRVEKLTNTVAAAKDIANRAPTPNQMDEWALQMVQIQLLSEILGALWRAEQPTISRVHEMYPGKQRQDGRPDRRFRGAR